jgi:hypothetical protein
MANVKLAFLGAENKSTSKHELQCYVNSSDEIYLQIDMGDNFPISFICLDEETAVKFCKHLKSQIAIIKRHE